MVSVSLAGLTQRVNPYSCTAVRRPWTLFVSQKRAGAPFFVANLGTLTSCGLHRGGARGRAATPEADETQREWREGTLRTAALAKARRLP